MRAFVVWAFGESPGTGFHGRLIPYGISAVSKSRTMRPRMPPAAPAVCLGGVPGGHDVGDAQAEGACGVPELAQSI